MQFKEIDLDRNPIAVKLAQALTHGVSSDLNKVRIIYTFICWLLKYDHKKQQDIHAKVITKYKPYADAIIGLRKGICYDYAVLFAVMVQAAGVRCKLIKGYIEGSAIYHAWNEVYIKVWRTVDPTGEFKIMFRDRRKYTAVKEYE